MPSELTKEELADIKYIVFDWLDDYLDDYNKESTQKQKDFMGRVKSACDKLGWSDYFSKHLEKEPFSKKE